MVDKGIGVIMYNLNIPKIVPFPAILKVLTNVGVMNYIALINQFWQIRRSKIITSVQADLYKFLLHESNMRNWENPLRITNGVVCANIGITEKTLIDARNRLQQIGLIKFQGGVSKKQSPTYLILDSDSQHCKNSSIGVSFDVSYQGGYEGGNQGSFEANINNKLNNTKRNKTSASNEAVPVVESKPKKKEPTGQKKESGLPAKKKEDVTPHWSKVVDVWFRFYEQHFKERPTFEGPATKALKDIVNRLQKMSEAKGYEWDEQYAEKVLTHFLLKAIAVEWRKNNFLLPILNNHFDAIIQKNEHETAATKSKPGQSGLNDLEAELNRKLYGVTGQ